MQIDTVLQKIFALPIHMLIIYLFNYEINTQIETFPEVITQSSGISGGLKLKIKK